MSIKLTETHVEKILKVMRFTGKVIASMQNDRQTNNKERKK
jgi:hypothetical protein